MKKIAIFFLISAAAGIALAQEDTATTIAPEETITIEDLGITEPGILPTSPFYFFKEMGRGLQSFITFNPVSKAELELKFANEKAAEIKKITETQPQNTEAIKGALENYQKSQKNLRARFEKISETSQNPKVNALLDKFTDKTVKHEKLFDEISFKFKGEKGIANAIRSTMAESEDVIGEASKKDDAAKFASRLEKVLLKEKGGDLKHARSVEIIDRFGGKATTEIKESLGRLREEFSEKLETDINYLLEKSGENAVKEGIFNTPGDLAARSVIIEEIQKRAEQRLSQALEKAREPLERLIQKEIDIAKKAEEQIKRAEEMIQRAEKMTSKSDSVKIPAVVSTLLGEAKEHLANGKSAFEEEKYGEAFGQARSAEVLSRNALKFFEQEKPETESLEQRLKELNEKISAYRNLLKERGYTEEQNKDAYEFLNNAVLHLEYAEEAFAKGSAENTKLHISHAKDFLAKLARILEGKLQIQPDEKPTVLPAKPSANHCEEITKNILELKDLLNSEKISESNFRAKYDVKTRELIICQGQRNVPAPLPSPKPVPPRTSVSPANCTQEYNPVCGSNGKTYSNICHAKIAGITAIYRGECKSKTETKTEIEKQESISPKLTPKPTETVKPRAY